MKDKRIRVSLLYVLIIVVCFVLWKVTLNPSQSGNIVRILYGLYLLLPETVANGLFRILHIDVQVVAHKLVFLNDSLKCATCNIFIENWMSYLSYFQYSLVIMLVIMIGAPWKKEKLLMPVFFLISHMLSVISGLVFTGLLLTHSSAPNMNLLYPEPIFGSILLFAFLAVVFFRYRDAIFFKLHIVAKNLLPTRRVQNELIILVLLLFLVRSFLLPVIDLNAIISLALRTTQAIVGVLGYPSTIDGIYLIGENGSMFINSHCLGLKTIYLFVALTYLTRHNIQTQALISYICGGVILLGILNVLRFVSVFIVVQGENGFAKATAFHDLFNVIVYIVVLILWILWIEIINKKYVKE